MHAELVFSRDDFALAFAEFTPVTIWLNEDRTHWLHIGTVTQVEIHPSIGVQVTCSAEIQWTLANLPTHARADQLRLHVRPALEPWEGGYRLAFRIAIEEASMHGLLHFFDKTIVSKIDKALEAQTLAWNYSHTLDRTFHLPERLFREVQGVRLKTRTSSDRISEGAVVFELDLEVGFERKKG